MTSPMVLPAALKVNPAPIPEELIGAAHAACFAMAMSAGLGEAGFTAHWLDAKSDVSPEKVPDGFAITGSPGAQGARPA